MVHALKLLRRWPALTLLPFGLFLLQLLFVGDTGSSPPLAVRLLFSPLPTTGQVGLYSIPLFESEALGWLLIALRIVVLAGFLQWVALGLRGEPLTLGAFCQGVTTHGGRLLAVEILQILLLIPLAAIAAENPPAGALFIGFFGVLLLLWAYAVVFENVNAGQGLLRSARRVVEQWGLFISPFLIAAGLNFAFYRLAGVPSAWRLPLGLGLYPLLNTWLAAWIGAAYWRSLGQEPQVIEGRAPHQASVTTLLTLLLVAVGWFYASGAYRYVEVLLPGHQPVQVLEGYRYEVKGSGVSLPNGPNARLVFDSVAGLTGRGRLYLSDDGPPLVFSFSFKQEGDGPFVAYVARTLRGFSGLTGEPFTLHRSADQRVFSLMPWEQIGPRGAYEGSWVLEAEVYQPFWRQTSFLDLGYAYAAPSKGVGLYFAHELPDLQELALLVDAVQGHYQTEPAHWPLWVGSALTKPTQFSLMRLLEGVEGDWPDPLTLTQRFELTFGSELPIMQVRPVLQGEGDERTFSGSVVRSNGDLWPFTGTLRLIDGEWRLVHLDTPVLRKD